MRYKDIMTMGPFSVRVYLPDPDGPQDLKGKLFASIPGGLTYLRPDGTAKTGTNPTGVGPHGSGYYDTLAEVIEAYAKYCAKQSAPVAHATPSAPTIEPGEGYRLLAKDELVEEGDEHYNPWLKKWVPSLNYADGAQATGRTYRRKLHATSSAPIPGGWCALGPEDIVQIGDRVLYASGNHAIELKASAGSPVADVLKFYGTKRDPSMAIIRKLPATPSAPAAVAKRRRVIVDRDPAKLDTVLVDVYEHGSQKCWAFSNGSTVYYGDLPKTWTIVAVVNEG